MKTPLDYFFDGYKEWGDITYGRGFHVYRGNINGVYRESMNYALNYMIGKLHEKNATKTKSKANAKSKLKDGKQVKNVLRAKKKVSRRLS